MTIDEVINHLVNILSEANRTGDAVCYITSEDNETIKTAIKALRQQPSVRPKIKPIGYRECADAMLKMWMDNVLTDGEYYRIMDKLNAKWNKMNEVAE